MDQPTTTQPTGAPDLTQFLGVEPPSRRARLVKWGAVAVVVLVVALLAARWIFGGTPPAAYAVQPIERGNLTVPVSATGNLTPTKQVNVGSEQSGIITDVYVQNNDRVARGQPLARLDTARLTDTLQQSIAAVASAEASVAQNQATLMQAQATLARYQEVYRLSGGKVPSQTELDTARADYARAVANVRAARAAVTQAQATVRTNRTNLAKATIYSPVDGVVLSRQAEPGQTVAAGLQVTTLFTIAEDLSRMKLEVKVDEADVGEVRAGQAARFTVDAYPGRTFPATVTRVDVGANATPQVNSAGTTVTSTSTVVAYTAILSVANPELQLKPGMTATADIITAERRGVLLVPNAALRFRPDAAGAGQSRGGLASVMVPRPRRGGGGGGGAQRQAEIGRGSRQTIYVLGDKGQPRPIEVVVGQSNGSQTEVSGPGVKPGLQVVTGRLAQQGSK